MDTELDTKDVERLFLLIKLQSGTNQEDTAEFLSEKLSMAEIRHAIDETNLLDLKPTLRQAMTLKMRGLVESFEEGFREASEAVSKGMQAIKKLGRTFKKPFII